MTGETVGVIRTGKGKGKGARRSSLRRRRELRNGQGRAVGERLRATRDGWCGPVGREKKEKKQTKEYSRGPRAPAADPR